MDFKDFFQKKKNQLKASHLFRELRLPCGLDFCSNDYLGFSENRELQSRIKKKISLYPLGSGGSRLLRGHSLLTEELESKLSWFSGKPEALFFPTGYQANLALFSSLLREEARVFSDELIHASIIDGIRLSGAEKWIWKHNDLNELECLLRKKAGNQKMNFVVVESVYSMEGDFAPLSELAFLCERYHCHLIVDEAHATGLFGKRGSGRVGDLGLCERVFARIHTGGKALGVSGAWITGSRELKDFMVNFSRPFIYSTAPSFPQQLALLEALNYFLENKESLKREFFEKLEFLQNAVSLLAEKFEFTMGGCGGPVTSFVVGDNKKALTLMRDMAARGYDVRAIRPPSVPQGRSLLRITVPLKRSFQEIEDFLKNFEKSLESSLI